MNQCPDIINRRWITGKHLVVKVIEKSNGLYTYVPCMPQACTLTQINDGQTLYYLNSKMIEKDVWLHTFVTNGKLVAVPSSFFDYLDPAPPPRPLRGLKIGASKYL